MQRSAVLTGWIDAMCVSPKIKAGVSSFPPGNGPALPWCFLPPVVKAERRLFARRHLAMSSNTAPYHRPLTPLKPALRTFSPSKVPWLFPSRPLCFFGFFSLLLLLLLRIPNSLPDSSGISPASVMSRLGGNILGCQFLLVILLHTNKTWTQGWAEYSADDADVFEAFIELYT